nr:GNAT family N-acetyltransferase [uncultured Actinoplanes sp.]
MQTLSAAQAEAVEAEFMYQVEAGAPAHDQEVLGIATERLAGGVVLSARNDPTAYWSKALGFGFDEPVSGHLIDQILDVWRAEQNPSGVLQIAPEVMPDDWDEIRETRGLEPGERIAKLAAPIGDVVAGGPGAFRIAPVEKEDADRWARAVLDGFGMPYEGIAGMLVAMAAHPRFHAYAAWDGDTIAGGGTLFVQGEIGELVAGAVLERYRKRGAQTALIAERVRKARELGCRWVVAETAEGRSGNMLRAGLKQLYIRQNHVWHAA